MRQQILKALEKNSRIEPKDLAVMLNTDEISLINEISLMEKEGIICGYHALINWDKTTDERCSAFIEVKVTPQRGVGFDNIASRIMHFDEVDSIYLMAGVYDFAVLIEGKTMKEVSKFVFEKLSALEQVMSTSTHFVLKRYKDHGVILDNPKDEDKRLKVSL